MSIQLLYEQAKRISECMPFGGGGACVGQSSKTDHVLLAAFDVLTKYDGIADLVNTMHDDRYDEFKPCPLDVVERVLLHVVKRTLPYNKHLEAIRVTEIMHGSPMHSIAGIPRSKKNRVPVTTALNALVDSGLLVRLRFPLPDKVSLYGLHLPTVLGIILSIRLKSIAERLKLKTLRELTHNERSHHFLSGFALLVATDHRSASYAPAFDYLSQKQQRIKNVNLLCENLKKLTRQYQEEFDPDSDYFDEMWKIRNNHKRLSELWKQAASDTGDGSDESNPYKVLFP